jgi:hypothetical protein
MSCGLVLQESAVEQFRQELEARNAWRKEDHGEGGHQLLLARSDQHLQQQHQVGIPSTLGVAGHLSAE